MIFHIDKSIKKYPMKSIVTWSNRLLHSHQKPWLVYWGFFLFNHAEAWTEQPLVQDWPATPVQRGHQLNRARWMSTQGHCEPLTSPTNWVCFSAHEMQTDLSAISTKIITSYIIIQYLTDTYQLHPISGFPHQTRKVSNPKPRLKKKSAKKSFPVSKTPRF